MTQRYKDIVKMSNMLRISFMHEKNARIFGNSEDIQAREYYTNFWFWELLNALKIKLDATDTAETN